MRRGAAIWLFLLLPAVFATANEDLAGTYNGQWTGKDGKSGKYALTLTRDDAGKWNGEVAGGMDGRQFKAAMTSLDVHGSSFEATYEVALTGGKVMFKIAGQKSEETMAGQFQALAEGKQVDAGTWTTTWIHAQPRLTRP